MRLSNRLLKMFLLLGLLAAAGLIIAQKETASKQNVVEDLTVEDLPADDGSGLILSWKPLHRSKRIIEYRIYRGIDPDTLFFLQSVQVNVNTGVAADRMYYYDSGGGDFIDLSSPGKLRKEKQQDDKSPLYRNIPRDMELAARLSEKFDIISYVERPAFYKHGRKVWSADAADSTAYAGFKFKHQNLQAGLRAQETYYYTVVAVNERNQFQDYAKPVAGTPVGNPPDPATALYGSWLADTKEYMFEWDYPLVKDDILQYQLYRVKDMPDSLWARLKTLPDTLGIYRQPLGDPGPVQGGQLPNYTRFAMPEMSSEEVASYRYAIELADMEGSSLSDLVTIQIADSKALPAKPSFYTEDKPNDKGDRLTVIWDKPITFVTKTTSLNAKNTRLKINYQLNKAETQKVNNIYFSLYIPGQSKPFVTINEFYQDLSFKIKVPAGYDYRKGFRVRITMKGKDIDPRSYILEQDLEWDTAMMALMPGKQLWRNGEEVSRIQNVVYRRGIRSPNYYLVKRNTSFDSNLDVNISYPTMVPRLVSGFNFVKGNTLHTYMNGKRFSRPLKAGESKAGYALVSPIIDFTFDKDKEALINTSIFKDEALKSIDLLKKEVADLKAQVAGLPANADSTLGLELKAKLEAQEKKLALFTENKHMQAALKRGSDRSWIKYIAGVREPESRNHSYQIVKTNGRGLFTVSDPDTSATGEVNFYYPVSNWFAKEKLITLFAVLLYGALVVSFVTLAKRGKDLYIRPIAGLDEIDNAVGRATEMGRPMLYCMGSGTLSEVSTLASMGILTQVAKRAAEYDTKLIVPCYDYIVMPVVQEIVREAHYSVGRPDTYDKNNIFYLTNSQFAYVAGVNGIMIREKMATNFFLGFFAAEALLMTETGNTVGAVQIAGSDAITQIPFFITTCDYTLIGEELYAASAYLNREPMLLGTLKAQDYLKIIIVFLVLVGTILSTLQVTNLLNILPTK